MRLLLWRLSGADRGNLIRSLSSGALDLIDSIDRGTAAAVMDFSVRLARLVSDRYTHVYTHIREAGDALFDRTIKTRAAIKFFSP